MCTMTEKYVDEDVLCEEPDEDFFDTFFDGMAPVLETIGESLRKSGTDKSGANQNSQHDLKTKQLFKLEESCASSSVETVPNCVQKRSENNNAVSKSVTSYNSEIKKPLHIIDLTRNEENYIEKNTDVQQSQAAHKMPCETKDFALIKPDCQSKWNIEATNEIGQILVPGKTIDTNSQKTEVCQLNTSDRDVEQEKIFVSNVDFEINLSQEETEKPCKEDEAKSSKPNSNALIRSGHVEICESNPLSSHQNSLENGSVEGLKPNSYGVKERDFCGVLPKITNNNKTQDEITEEVEENSLRVPPEKSRGEKAVYEETKTGTRESVLVSGIKTCDMKSDKNDENVDSDLLSKKPTLNDLLSAGKRSKILLKLKSKLDPLKEAAKEFSASPRPSHKTTKPSLCDFKTHSESDGESCNKEPKQGNKIVNKSRDHLSKKFEYREEKRSSQYSRRKETEPVSKRSPLRMKSQISRPSRSKSPDSYKWHSNDLRSKLRKRKRFPSPEYHRTPRIPSYERLSSSYRKRYSPTRSHKRSPSGSERSQNPSPTGSMKSLSRSLSQNSSRSDSLSLSRSPTPRPVHHYSRSRKKSQTPKSASYKSRSQRKSYSTKSGWSPHRVTKSTSSRSRARSRSRSWSRARSRSRSHSRSRSPFINELNRLKQQWDCEDRRKAYENNSYSCQPPLPAWNMDSPGNPDFTTVSVSFQSVQVGLCNTFYPPPPPAQCATVPQLSGTALSCSVPSQTSTNYFTPTETFSSQCTMRKQEDHLMECGPCIPEPCLGTFVPQPVPPPMLPLPPPPPSATIPSLKKRKDVNSPLSRQLVVMHTVLQAQDKLMETVHTDSIAREMEDVVVMEKKEPEVISCITDEEDNIQDKIKSSLPLTMKTHKNVEPKSNPILNPASSESSLHSDQQDVDFKKGKKTRRGRRGRKVKKVIQECQEVIKMLSVGRFILTADGSSGIDVEEKEIPSGSNSILLKRPEVTYSLCKERPRVEPSTEHCIKASSSKDASTNTSEELTFEVSCSTHDLIMRKTTACQTETLNLNERQIQDMTHQMEEMTQQLIKLKRERDEMAELVSKLKKQTIPGLGLDVSRPSEELHQSRMSNSSSEHQMEDSGLPHSSPSASRIQTSVENMLTNEVSPGCSMWDNGKSWPECPSSSGRVDMIHNSCEGWNTTSNILYPSETITSTQMRRQRRNRRQEPLIAFEYNHYSGVPTEVETRINASRFHTVNSGTVGNSAVAMRQSSLPHVDQ